MAYRVIDCLEVETCVSVCVCVGVGVQKERDVCCYKANIEEVEKSHPLPGIEPRTPSLGFQSLAIKLLVRQPGMCTAQVVLMASVAYPAATWYVPFPLVLPRRNFLPVLKIVTHTVLVAYK